MLTFSFNNYRQKNHMIPHTLNLKKCRVIHLTRHYASFISSITAFKLRRSSHGSVFQFKQSAKKESPSGVSIKTAS